MRPVDMAAAVFLGAVGLVDGQGLGLFPSSGLMDGGYCWR